MKELTEKQLAVLKFIQKYTEENVCPPTVREIAEYFSISIKAVQDHISALTKKGYITRSEKKSRSIRILVDDPSQEKPAQFVKVPLLGTIAAGKPLFCEENFEKNLNLPEEMFSQGKKYFALHVRGSSMINAGIMDGDIAIIQQSNTARNGQIVVALLDDSVTLKRFFKESTRIRLQPENPDFNPIYSQDVSILGILSHIVRTY